MHSQPQPAKLNIEPCISCEEKSAPHNQTDKEKQPDQKKQPIPQTDL
jgi:hypothetical protein